MISRLKNRLVRMFVLLIALFSNNLYSVEENAGKYEGFVFTPVYPSETVDFKVKDILERDKMLLDFHEIDNLSSVEFLENSFWAIYSVKLRESKTDEYAAYKDQVTYIENRKLQFNEKESWTRLVKIKGQNVLLDVDLTKNKGNHSTAWSSGVFYGSGYGCVAESPIFSAPLSAGEEDFIFVVTAMKDQVGINFTGDSFVRLQIYNGKSGKVVVEEYPYLWSVIPTKQDGKLIAYRMRHVALWERAYGVDWRDEGHN